MIQFQKEDLINLDIKQSDFVLFKTRNSFEETFNYKFIYVDQSAALYLKRKKVLMA